MPHTPKLGSGTAGKKATGIAGWPRVEDKMGVKRCATTKNEKVN
jgi:hypothetical protein